MSTQTDSRRDSIDGSLYVASKRHDDGPVANVVDRWTGEPLARVVQADFARADAAASACADAFIKTRAMKAYERRDLLRRVASTLDARKEALATLLAREAGKPITQALGEVTRAIS